MIRRRPAALVVAGLGLLAGCGDDDEALFSSRIPSNGVEVDVLALDNIFRGERTVITPGTEVVFLNRGRNDHDITPAAGRGWGAPREDFTPGEVYRQVFVTPGEYPYYCKLHGTPTDGMIGVVVVEES